MTKFSNKLKKLFFLTHFELFFPILGPKKKFPRKPALPHTTLYEFLAPCQISEKKQMIQFQENACTEGRKDGRMDRPYFIGPFRLLPGVQKIII